MKDLLGPYYTLPFEQHLQRAHRNSVVYTSLPCPFLWLFLIYVPLFLSLRLAPPCTPFGRD